MTRRDSRSPNRRSTRARRPFRRLDLIITLVGVLGLILFLAFYDQAFPSAAINLALSQAEIALRASAYLESLGYDLQGYRSALTFDENTWASFYLQRTLGVPETNRLIRETQVPIWRWRARWFRPLQKEEFLVHLAPDGRVVGLTHTVLEDAPGASLDQRKARSLGRDYLSRDHGWALDEWEEVSASSRDRPGGRTDHYFEWKRRGWDVGESELRLALTVQGDAVGSYDYWLKVPEAFQRTFAQNRNIPSFIDALSFALSFALAGSAAVLALWRASWRPPPLSSTLVGPALAVGLVSLANSLNELPLAKAWYGTTSDYALFWIDGLTSAFFAAALIGLIVFLLWYLGQWLSKRVWPRRDRVLSRRGDRWHTLASSGWRGLMLALIHAGYVVVFYLVATQLVGGWTPMAPDYTRAFATPLPFLGALATGLLPAMWEELMFRLLLVTAVLWFARTFTQLSQKARRFLALLLPGALWGFAHLSYIRDPFYLRGIELTLSAIVYGLFFLRFGLTTTIVAHFAYNAGLTALPLLRSGEPRFVASGVVVVGTMLAPMIPGLAREIRRRLRGELRDSALPRIRPASAADLESLTALPVVGFDWEELVNDPAGAVLCLLGGGEPVGVAAGKVSADGVGRILAVYVDPSRRRRYWGSELVEELRRRLEELGARSVETLVSTDDKVELRFWISQGWKRATVVFRWPPQPLAFPSWRDVLRRLRHRGR